MFLSSEWGSLLVQCSGLVQSLVARPRGSQAHSTSVEAACLRRGNGSVRPSLPPTPSPRSEDSAWDSLKDPTVSLRPGDYLKSPISVLFSNFREILCWFRLEVFALLFPEGLFQVHSGGEIQTWV